jgi:hypothetical protein
VIGAIAGKPFSNQGREHIGKKHRCVHARLSHFAEIWISSLFNPLDISGA